MDCLQQVATLRWLAFCWVKVKWALWVTDQSREWRREEWVEGQYQQCAYGGKMLGGHWGKESWAHRHGAVPRAALPGMDVIALSMRQNVILDHVIFMGEQACVCGISTKEQHTQCIYWYGLADVFKAPLINIFILVINRLTMWNVEWGDVSDNPTEDYHLTQQLPSALWCHQSVHCTILCNEKDWIETSNYEH